ncbi:MAG: response regulator [Acidobacteriota bacterium]
MTERSSTRYKVLCNNCRGAFDAMTASWCSCLQKDRSLRCPLCDQCFCTAPASFKKGFWAAAPPEMWARKQSEQKKDAPFSNPPPGEVKRPLVQIVDDEKEIVNVAIRVVLGLGYGVIVARDGEEGLAMVKEYLPDLVLSDAMMPKMDGREMARRIKDDPLTSKTTVVIMTSLYTDARYKTEALKNFRVDAYVAKPLRAPILREMLQKYLG